MNDRIDIVIDRIVRVLHETSFVSDPKRLYNSEYSEICYYYTLKNFPKISKRLLRKMTYTNDGWISKMESLEQEGDFWEFDEMFSHDFKKIKDGQIIETKYNSAGREYGRYVRKFNSNKQITYEDDRNEDYEEGFRKEFDYNSKNQLEKIIFYYPNQSRSTPSKEIQFIWKKELLEHIEVTNHMYDGTFYREYYFLKYSVNTIEVILHRRAYLDKMHFTFTQNDLMVWNRSLTPIGRQLHEDTIESIFFSKDKDDGKIHFVRATFRNGKFGSAKCSTEKFHTVYEKALDRGEKMKKTIHVEFDPHRTLTNLEYERLIGKFK